MGISTQEIKSSNPVINYNSTSYSGQKDFNITLAQNNDIIGDSFERTTQDKETKKNKLKKGLIIGGIALGAIAIGIGIAYLTKQKRYINNPLDDLTKLLDPQGTGVVTKMPSLDDLTKAGLSTKEPEFLYHLTNKSNYECMLKTGHIWQGYDKFSGHSIFTIELDNFLKNWNQILDSDIEMKAKLLKQAAKRGDDVILLQIPTKSLKKEKLFIRSENAYFKYFQNKIYDYDDAKRALLFTPENRTLVNEGKTSFTEIVANFYRKLILKNESPLVAKHLLGETPAEFASLLDAKGEALEYLYREEIMMDSVKKIGEIKLSDYDGLSEIDLIKKAFGKLFNGITNAFNN
ncbi:MAG: hypothetical protein IKL52_07075 [Candidatus Gastranaerophilales bacterium]|nr:hypothetical protein [Candidatus Gastranaerophilales bacterium]